MGTFMNTNDPRLIRFLKRRFESSTNSASNAAVRPDLMAARGEHQRLRMGI